jgi:hypothetical protein
MSRRIEIYPTAWGKVRMETWMGNRCMEISAAISREDADIRVEKMGEPVEVVDHTQHKFKRPAKNMKIGSR